MMTVSNWFKDNNLSVNASKNQLYAYGISNRLEKVKLRQFLGVIFDECLTWKKHIDCREILVP